MKQQKFNSVWDAIKDTEAEAISMKARAELMTAISEAIQKMNTTQTAAAKTLGLTQPRLNDLLHGHISRFSLDALFDIASRAGIKVKLTLKAA